MATRKDSGLALLHVPALLPLRYSPIDTERQEIRVLMLQPGQLDDDLHFEMTHQPLEPPALSRARRRLAVDELQATMPPGWTAVETNRYQQYRYLFEEDDTMNTSWSHPDPRMDQEFWSPVPETPPAGFEPAYEALSYTWGTQLQRTATRVLQNGAESCLKISLSLSTALRHLRYTDRTRCLWCDAICINQQDTAEREQQVQRMADIYSYATRAVIWLGPGSESSSHALQTIKYLGDQIQLGRDLTRYRVPGALELEWFRAACPLPYGMATWHAIASLFEIDYFERLWIWQETQLANSRAIVVCGVDCIPWQCMRRAVSAIATKSMPVPSLRRSMEKIYPLTHDSSGASTALLLSTSRDRMNKDPRDKIYGLLSLAGESLTSHITPNYTKEAGEVYQSVFEAYTNHTQRLDLLAGCDSSERRIDSPSWVPNYAMRRKTRPLTAFQLCSGMSASDVQFHGPGLLIATGVMAGCVETVSEPASEDLRRCIPILSKWEQLAVNASLDEMRQQQALDVVLWTIRAGYLADRMPRYAD